MTMCNSMGWWAGHTVGYLDSVNSGFLYRLGVLLLIGCLVVEYGGRVFDGAYMFLTWVIRNLSYRTEPYLYN